MASKDDTVRTVMVDLDRFLAMQAEHLTSLQNGCLAKINQWFDERQSIVGSLRQALAEVQSSDISPEIREVFLEKLGCILDREKILNDISKQQHSSLSEKLSALRRGKKALNGYGPAITPSPHFVSNKR